jgi:hypothetical protein
MAGGPILIVGTERSGSNLLRLMLDAHPSIAVPHPPHVVRYLAPLVAGYGDLSRDPGFRALCRDMVRLVQVHIHPWPFVPSVERLVAEAPARTVIGAWSALYAQYLAHSGKRRWACKSTFMVDFVGDVAGLHPDARFLWLVRDPRDVAVSSRRSVFSTFHPAHTGALWAAQQATGRRWADAMGPEVVRVVRYERLVAEPEAELREICAFVGEVFVPEMLRFFEGAEARRTAALAESWSRTGEPADTASVERWRGQLTLAEVTAVEAAAREQMQRLGYPLTTSPGPAPGGLTRLGWWASGLASRVHVEARSLRADRNFGRRWARDAFVAWLRVRRGLVA